MRVVDLLRSLCAAAICWRNLGKGNRGFEEKVARPKLEMILDFEAVIEVYPGPVGAVLALPAPVRYLLVTQVCILYPKHQK